MKILKDIDLEGFEEEYDEDVFDDDVVQEFLTLFNSLIDEKEQLDEEYLTEMAIINPKLCRNSTIQVEIEQRDEGPIPHMHVYHDKTRNPKKCSYIRLDKAEYAPHHNINLLSNNEKEEFIRIMCSPWIKPYDTNNRVLTGYQQAVQIWLDTFGDIYHWQFDLDENGLPIMPDYTKL